MKEKANILPTNYYIIKSLQNNHKTIIYKLLFFKSVDIIQKIQYLTPILLSQKAQLNIIKDST